MDAAVVINATFTEGENRMTQEERVKELWAKALLAGTGERKRIITELVSSMDLEEKVNQMHGSMSPWEMVVSVFRYNHKPFRAGWDPKLGIPPLLFSDGPRGIAVGNSTCFPVSMARGASWDPELEERVGRAMGKEARARGANLVGAPCINLLRHPGWGRAQETYGEDPFHVGEMGAALVRGLQEEVLACPKHFACNSIEESRFWVDVLVDERTLREVYLPHFRRCIEVGAACVMSAYNRVNGEYCAHNRHLLREILKGEWGFRGIVISDFVLGTRDTVRAVIGGLDVEMPQGFHYARRLLRAVREGRVPEALVDEAVGRILAVKADYFSRRTPVSPAVGVPALHRELALEAARKSLVLLKNEKGALPLRGDEVRRLAVVGRLAAAPNLGDMGSSRVRPPYAVTPLEGITGLASQRTEILYCEGSDLEEVSRVSASADACVVVVGLTHRQEGEFMLPLPERIKLGGDREDLSLPRRWEEVILAAAGANPRTVVVLMGGSAITVERWIGEVPAVLMAWYPGMEGGWAVAESLFGVVNPGGKLPFSIPGSEADLPPFGARVKRIRYGYLHGYRWLDSRGLPARFPFGHGLSYTSFVLRGTRVLQEKTDGLQPVGVEVELENAGPLPGDEVVQAYVSVLASRVERPPKVLAAFKRVSLQPGEKMRLHLEIDPSRLSFYDTTEGQMVTEKADYRVMVGTSSQGLVEAGVFAVD